MNGIMDGSIVVNNELAEQLNNADMQIHTPEATMLLNALYLAIDKNHRGNVVGKTGQAQLFFPFHPKNNLGFRQFPWMKQAARIRHGEDKERYGIAPNRESLYLLFSSVTKGSMRPVHYSLTRENELVTQVVMPKGYWGFDMYSTVREQLAMYGEKAMKHIRTVNGECVSYYLPPIETDIFTVSISQGDDENCEGFLDYYHAGRYAAMEDTNVGEMDRLVKLLGNPHTFNPDHMNVKRSHVSCETTAISQ